MEKTESLKKNIEFKSVFQRGKWLRGKCIVLYYLPTKLKLNRLGIAVSKKIGGSVTRNRIKRLIRESYRLNEASIKNGYDIVILWKNYNESPLEYEKVSNDLKKLFNKSGLIDKGCIENQ